VPPATARTKGDPPGELYDLETDPQEKVNLCEAHPGLVCELKTRLDALLKAPRWSRLVSREVR
jgi:hypothetical protein